MDKCPDCLHVYADQDWQEGCQCDNECPQCGEEFECFCHEEDMTEAELAQARKERYS
jgi:hypothetical protein